MGVKRSSRACNDWKICAEVFVGIILIWAATNSFAVTNPVDGNSVWLLRNCEKLKILNGANLGGELGDSLGDFASITVFFLSANQFSGSIPSSVATLTLLTDM
ncbi:hypothetical protein Q3G72_021329 [Acer saccharum]|nr:hypothetical protein Q3G72_021329 [Acer saccharum]